MHSPHEINDRDLARWAADLDPPAFFKDASGRDIAGDGALDAAGYADPVDGFYPTHTKAATWASHAKFAEASGALADARRRLVAERLALAARRHRIEPEVAALAAKRAALDAAAAAPPAAADCAWVGPGGEGRLPIRTAAEVAKAAEYLSTYRDRFAYAGRFTISSRTLAKAAALGVDLGDRGEALERMAGLGGSPSALVKRAIAARADRLRARHPAEAAELDALKSAVAPGWGRDTLLKLAKALDDVDAGYGLRAGDRPAGYPEDELFAVTRSKLAALADGVGTATGAVYRRADLAAADPDALGDAMGPEFAAGLCDGCGMGVDPEKAAALLPRLDAATAGAIEAALAAQGIAPLARLAPGRRSRLDRAGTLALAAAAAG